MNTAEIIGITKPLKKVLVEQGDYGRSDVYREMTADEFVVYVARVSNPSNQMNMMTGPQLLKYLIRKRHWSPFEHVSITMDIETTRDISHQISVS